jgi:GWxTD domain-containing protein
MRNRRSNSVTASLAAVLLACATLAISGNLTAQSSSVGQKFVAGDSAPTPLAGPYRTWLEQDVHWIIADDESSAYLSLQRNAERQQFIVGFWERRDPTAGSGENTFKQEHYRRLAYANEQFAGPHPGWKSDRGRIYVLYGKPDSIDAHPSSVGGETTPFEVWHYDSAHSAAPWQASNSQNIDFKFVDACHCGDYKLSSPLPPPSPEPDEMRKKD